MSNIMTKKEENLLSIILNKPETSNTLTRELLEELDCLLDLVKDEPTIRVIIVSGSGEKAFSAGLDYNELLNFNTEEAFQFSCYGQQVFQKLMDLPQPIIAAINGRTTGVGCELALACDLRIASANAIFSLPETTLGLTPCFGGVERLLQLIGIAQTKELLFLGKQITADEAFSLGLVNKVVAFGLAQSAARNLGRNLCSASSHALCQTKQLINYYSLSRHIQGLNKEALHFSSCFLKEDYKEALSSLLTKSKPIFHSKKD
jgi:enoyl-CoA hydratase